MNAQPADDRPLTSHEREEYERLRAHAAVRHRRLRTLGASVLLLLVFVLAPVGVLARWVNSQVTDTDRYVATVAPLASEPAVQNAVTDRLTNRVMDQIDVKKITDELANTLAANNAPPAAVQGARLLTDPLKGAINGFVHDVVHRVVTSDQFKTVWVDANEQAHAAVVKVLTGQGGSAVQAKGDDIVLDIGTVVENVQKRLVDAGFQQAAAIPQVDKSVVLVHTDKLNDAQEGMRLLDIVGTWLPVAIVVLAGAAIWLAPAHRVALMAAGIGVAVMMVVLFVGLAVARQIYLDSVPLGTQSPAAAAEIYDTLVRYLRQSTGTVLVIAVIAAVAGYLYGPGRGARALRSGARRTVGALGRGAAREGLRTGQAGRWLDTHRRWTTGIVIGAGALALVIWNYPTAGAVALVFGLVLLVLLILGVLAAAGGNGPPRREHPGAGH
ncbi:hypothetical protein [Streptomyces sp. SAJ15]|uniref:hypothetical protein n=1 Tax=Streptomyces sp. SAJ15 TaxID=2011095 RepID=UPI00118606B1|nr:hypothetical protein [Streptomyces sp. SAJ15]TVL92492.1 hypothetical protein CD790_12510 [Streptomyces sp. SAJ15]